MERPERRRFSLKRIETLLWIAGFGCASVCLLTAVHASSARRVAAQIEVAGAPKPAVAAPEKGHPSADAIDGVMGRMEVPELGLTVPIMTDFDPESLRRGVGHIRGTALPGGLGTVGLAGHRDTYFRPLRRIAAGMSIHLVDTHGSFRYEVDWTEIVSPEQVRVLDIQDQPELTLITCYPFDFVGAAPQRFIVHAHLLSLTPEPAAKR